MEKESNHQKVIEYGKQFIGTKYEWWKGGEIPTKAPMWAEHNKQAPEKKEISSVNCAGLLNLIWRHFGIELPYSPRGGIGGTLAYYEYYSKTLEIFDPQKTYSQGTLLLRKYRNEDDQGHVALIADDQFVLQAIPDEGVTLKYTLKESHAGYFYEFTVPFSAWFLPKQN
jgi:cell wall-associated NlpC family hydrolase